MDCQVMPLFDETYLINCYQSGHGQVKDVLRAFLRRLSAMRVVSNFDLVVIEYELLPYFPAFLEQWLNWRNVPYVVDYDDALFHQYDLHKNSWVRRFLGRKIARVMRGAQLVMAGNSYLADYARDAGSSRVEILPTVVDLERYPSMTTERPTNDVFTIGWIGSPSTAKYLQAIAPALAEVCADGKARVRLVGSGHVELSGVPVEVLPWQENTEMDQLQQFDVGIMPLPDAPWARGKCGFKIIQYMASRVPVVASPVGVNREIVEQGANGFLANTIEDWVAALQALRLDVGLRHRLGKVGRSKVEKNYSLQVAGPRLVKIMQSVVDDVTA